MDETLKQIIGKILQLSEKETHSDKVAGVHAILMKVNMAVGKQMEAMRDNERKQNSK